MRWCARRWRAAVLRPDLGLTQSFARLGWTGAAVADAGSTSVPTIGEVDHDSQAIPVQSATGIVTRFFASDWFSARQFRVPTGQAEPLARQKPIAWIVIGYRRHCRWFANACSTPPPIAGVTSDANQAAPGG